jgi:hypothetical protein
VSQWVSSATDALARDGEVETRLVTIISAVPGNGFLLGVPPDSDGVGGRIEVFPDTGGQNQRWVFAEPLEGPV